MIARLARAAFFPILAAALAACADGPADPELATGTDTDAPAFTATAAGHNAGILDLIDAWDAAWAAKDAAAYAATYTEDTEVINPVGGFLVGRAGVEAAHLFLFNPAIGPFRVSTSISTLRDLVFLTGNIALVKIDLVLTNLSAVPPGLPQAEPGVVRNRVTWVAVRQNGTWLILHQQMTPIPPLP